jgi:hypothetical protein
MAPNLNATMELNPPRRRRGAAAVAETGETCRLCALQSAVTAGPLLPLQECLRKGKASCQAGPGKPVDLLILHHCLH